MSKVVFVSLIVCLIGLSSSQYVPSLNDQVNQLDQYVANLTSADIAAAKNYIYTSSENAVNSAFAPFINNATDVMLGLINTANQTAQNFTQVLNNAISFNANGDTYSIQIAGGNATITFGNITNDEVAALTKVCEVYNKTGNLSRAIDDFLRIVAEKNQQAAQAVAEVLSSFFPIYFENLWEKIKCILDPNCSAYGYSDNSDYGATVEATECSTVAEPTNCEVTHEKTMYGNTAPESTNCETVEQTCETQVEKSDCETSHEKTEYGNTAHESSNCETVEQTCETEVEKTECETSHEKTEYGNTAHESSNCETVEQTCETEKEETCETVQEHSKSSGNTASESTYCESDKEKTEEETCETVAEESKSNGNTASESTCETTNEQAESSCETDAEKTKSDGNTASESTCKTDAEVTESTKQSVHPDGLLPPNLSDADEVAGDVHSGVANAMGNVQSGLNNVMPGPMPTAAV